MKNYYDENEWPEERIIKKDLTAWKTNLTKEISEEIGPDLRKYEDQAASYYGNAGGLKKNPLAIARTLELAWKDGVKSNLLIELIDRIVRFLEGK